MCNCSALGPNSRREISGWKFYCSKLQMLKDVDCSGNCGSMFHSRDKSIWCEKKKVSPKQTLMPTFSVLSAHV